VFELSRSGKSEDGVIHIDTDVSKEESVGAAFAQIENRTDKIDVLVSNAGMGISGAAEYTCLSEAKRLFDVNFFGMVSVINHAMPLLKAAKGRIVAVSSAAAVLPCRFRRFIRLRRRQSILIASRWQTKSGALA
jgi:NAD(P)-dependent dehydrogenase (short-subunit alcohol dehydrogenase family)